MNAQPKIAELIELAASYHSFLSEEEETYSREGIVEAMENYLLPDPSIEMYLYPKTIKLISQDKALIPGWWFINPYNTTTLIEISNDCR